MVDGGGSRLYTQTHSLKLVGLVWWLAATWCSMYIHLTGWQQIWKTWNTQGFLWTWNSQGILCNLGENWLLRSGCSICRAMQLSVSGAWKLLIWLWNDGLLLVTRVVVDVEW